MARISHCKLFSFLTACFPCKKNYQVPLRKVTLLMLGLENAEKTDTARVLKGESSIDVTTTIGFSRINFIRENFDVTIFDIGGGGKGIRTLWKYYYAESYGLIFVIDSSDVNRIEESKEAINEILKHPTMSGKPVLVLADNQDKEGALSETCLAKCLSLDTLINEQKCLCQLKGCSTLLFTGKKIDKSIKKGIFWLLSCIGNDFYTLKPRVERDTKAQQIFEEMKKRQRAERVRQLRREREEREKEYATEHPEFLRFDSDIDLFKPTDIALRENERRKQRMDKDIDRIFLRTHIEQEKSDIQIQFSNASERKFDDSIRTESDSVLSYILPTEKEIDSAQQLSDYEDTDFNKKKKDTFGVIACNQIVPHNISNPDLVTQEMPGPSHPIYTFMLIYWLAARAKKVHCGKFCPADFQLRPHPIPPCGLFRMLSLPTCLKAAPDGHKKHLLSLRLSAERLHSRTSSLSETGSGSQDIGLPSPRQSSSEMPNPHFLVLLIHEVGCLSPQPNLSSLPLRPANLKAFALLGLKLGEKANLGFSPEIRGRDTVRGYLLDRSTGAQRGGSKIGTLTRQNAPPARPDPQRRFRSPRLLALWSSVKRK
ncbi:uncharacterized protein LOC141561979 [Sminthopsis crassicaudata]|uniref:uncharacterized protein LOC141561979 n=1 Tax=Sminthopsis crassicaudata TaxID=9301 RepID=UPI003D68AFE2